MSWMKEMGKLLEAMGNPKPDIPPPPEVPEPKKPDFVPIPPFSVSIPEPMEDMMQRIVREELTRWFGPPPQE